MSSLFPFKGTYDDLASEVESVNKLVIVDCYTSWCPTCRRLGMLLPKIADENEDVLFLKADLDENPELKEFFKLPNIPVLKFFKANEDGKCAEVDSVVGLNVNSLREKIQQYK